jgi:hypothetical protein
MTKNQLKVREILTHWGINADYEVTPHMADMTIHALECENIQCVFIDDHGILKVEFYEDEQSTIQFTQTDQLS